MVQIIIRIIAALIILGGVILIFDARPITKRYFGFGDQNQGAMGLKMLGFIIAIIGAVIFYIVGNIG
jgi:hypothetical protein